MKFNEAQSKSIYDFVMKYNSDEEFRNNVQKSYDVEISQLPILHIYVLEEILRYGTKQIFSKFLETKGANTEEQAVDLFDGFTQLLKADVNFKQYKMEQLKNLPETLSDMEMFAFRLISESESKKEQLHEETIDELECDPLNPILFSYDKQTRETLENLFFGEFIHQMLELPTMKSVKERQKENGRIASMDKPLIIEKIQDAISSQGSMSQFKQIIDQRYIKVKMELLMGKGKTAFDQYLKFNTNISANEILGIEKDTTVDDMYADLKDTVNKKKANGESFTQDDAMDMINKIRKEGNRTTKR